MAEQAVHMALVESASEEGVARRARALRDLGPQEVGWSFANILETAPRLRRQLEVRGFFRLYLASPDSEGRFAVRWWARVGKLLTFETPTPFVDPVDGHRYLVHSRMRLEALQEMAEPIPLEALRSLDQRRPDPRHLELGFLFVADPEA